MTRRTPLVFDMFDHIFHGHSIKINREDIPSRFKEIHDFTKFWKVEVYGIGTYFVGAGHPEGKNQFVVWTPDGNFWHSFGKNITDAVKRATIYRLTGNSANW